MKTLKNVMKVLVALAAVAGAVYALSVYGDKIAAWCRNIIAKITGKACETEEVPAEPAPAAEEPSAEVPAAEAAAEEPAAAADGAPVADESDFAD